MKKVIGIIFALLVSIIVTPNASYSENTTTLEGAIIIEGRTLLPLRSIFETLSATVEWDQKTQSVRIEKGNTKILLTINSKKATVNGNSKSLDVPARLIGNKTMIPVRFVSEALGADVTWDAQSKITKISSEGKVIIVKTNNNSQTPASNNSPNTGKSMCDEIYNANKFPIVPIGKFTVLDNANAQYIYTADYLGEMIKSSDTIPAKSTEYVIRTIRKENNIYYQTSQNHYYLETPSIKYETLPSDIISCLEEKAVQTKSKNIISEASKIKTDLGKVMYVYDVISDETVLYSGGYFGNDPVNSQVGVFAYKSATSTGFSEAVKTLLDQLGINNKYVDTKKRRWNLVQIDGNWYHLDATRGYRVYDKYSLDGKYNYFLLSDQKIKQLIDYSLGDTIYSTSNKFSYLHDKRVVYTDYNYIYYRKHLHLNNASIFRISIDGKTDEEIFNNNDSIKEAEYHDGYIYISLNNSFERVSLDGQDRQVLKEGSISKFTLKNNSLYYQVDKTFIYEDSPYDRMATLYRSNLDGSSKVVINEFYDYQTLTGFYEFIDYPNILFYYANGKEYRVPVDN